MKETPTGIGQRAHRAAAGNRAGLHRNYIGFLERGERNPRVKTLFDVAHALGIGFAELTAGVAEPRK